MSPTTAFPPGQDPGLPLAILWLASCAILIGMAINSAVRAVQAVHTFMGSPLSFCHVIRYLLLVNLGDQKVHKMVKFCVHQCTQTARRYEAPSLLLVGHGTRTRVPVPVLMYNLCPCSSKT